MKVSANFSVCTYMDCDATPHPHFGAPLCLPHAKMIAVQSMTYALPPEPERGEVSHYSKPATPGRVYVIQHGNRVKIGFTTQPTRRLADLPHDRVLALIPGDRRLESALHKKFQSIRTSGEWFEDHPELIAFAENLAKKATA